MTKFSDVLAAGVTIRESADDGSDFTNPAADYRRLFLGEDGLLHVKDSAGTVTNPFTGGSPTIVTESTAASGDTTIVNTATFYDGVSESFLAGTYLVGGTLTVGVIVTTSQNYVWSWRLWDGTNIFMEGEFGPTPTGNLNGQYFSLPVGTMIVVLGSTTTLKISVSCNRGSSASAIKRNIGLNTGTSNKATQITGYKVT